MDPRLAKSIRDLFRKFGLRIERLDREHPEPWSSDREFSRLLAAIDGRTLVTADRCFFLYQLARLARPTPGAMAEVGVFRGGTARLIADTVPEKPFHLFDTFEGMPETAPTIDRHDKGDFAATSFESVREFLRDHPHIVFHRGLFPTTTAGLEHERFSFVHVDVDIYASVRSALEFFYPRVSPGGVLVFDDYEWKDCPGVKQALDEFLRDKPERPLITTRFQCALLRR